MTQLQFHEYCLLFPQADDKTLSDMADDIAKNGLTESIITYEGKILDGRNRYLACMQVNVEPHYTEYRGDEPLQFVVSKNLHRRHLNASQRALLADQVYKMAKAGDRITLGQAAKQLNVSQSNVQRAAQVNENASPAVKQAVMDGVTSLNKAHDTLKQAEQNTGVVITPKTTTEERTAVQVEQERILAADAPAPLPSKASQSAREFNADVLSGVYDGKRYRNDITEIQEIITKMEKLPKLYNDAYEMVQSLEQEGTLNLMVGVLVESVKKAEHAFRNDELDLKQVQKVITALQARLSVDIPKEGDKHELLAHLKDTFFEKASEVIADAEAIRKRLLTKHAGD